MSDFAVLVFPSQPAINFNVPHDLLAVIFFSAFISDDLWDHIVAETIAMLNNSFLNYPNVA